MKCLIIYFSQSGNTEKIARSIRDGVEEAAGHCDIASIKDINPRRLHEYDLIGVGAPVWGAKSPNNLMAFISNMRFVGGKHAFCFCTHGAIWEGFSPIVVSNLTRRGLAVIGSRDWFGDCTLYHHDDPYPTAGHPDEIDLKEARAFGMEMVERSRRVSAGEADLILATQPTPPPPPAPSGLQLAGLEVIKSYPSRMIFHPEKCKYPECRLCMDNCPNDGIDLTVTPPVLAKPCEACEFCARICPTGAIDIKEWLEAMEEANPILMEMVVTPKLAHAEAEGHFRRLLPKEETGAVANYRRRSKHPQWIVGKGYGEDRE